ncbi:hypothetical protein 8P_022 [Pseudomonas phage 8P]|nr:hypothetical protein 8P_022 [Pseudomonas phage 8P]
MFGFKTGASAKEEKKPAQSGTPQGNKPKSAPSPSMLGSGAAASAGFALKNRRAQIDAAAGYADGGKVVGPGTGTSDDVEAVVPEGSYIMPADSTEQIGEQNLAGMGAPVPVNLSNGEFQLPPEQVHAVGVQALDQMKDATHTPVEQQGAGFKPELFFADGGEVEDPRRKRYDERVARYNAGQTRANTPDPSLPNYANRPDATPSTPSAMGAGFKTLAGGVAMPFAVGIDAARSGAARLVGGDPNTLEGGADKYTDAAGSTLSEGLRDADQVVEGFKAGARDVLGVQKAQAAPSVVAPAAASPAQATPAATQARTQQAAPATTAATTPAATPAATTAPAVPAAGGDLPTDTTPRANDITRVGNSFSGTNIGPGYTINGRPSGESFQGQQSEQNKAAVDALMARTPEFGAGSGALATAAGQAPAMGFNPGGPSVTVIGDSSQQDRTRQRLISAASTAYRGAQNGQLTANQLRTMSDLIQSDDRNATSAATNAENNATRMAEAAMREQGQNARTQLQEQGQNSRFEASNELDQRRIAGEEEARGFSTRAAQRAERLYEQYDKAKPEDRAAIAQQIRELNGKDAPNRFTVVPGGQEIDPTTQQLVTRPAMVFNNQTGQFVPQQQSGTAQAPRPGETRGGYRFKGGNPADQNNWEKI